MQGSQNGRFINLHNSLKLQNSQKHKKYKITKNKQNNFYKIKQNCCKSGSSLMIADPLWSCVMLLCGLLWVFCGSFVVLCGPLRYLVIPAICVNLCLNHLRLCLCDAWLCRHIAMQCNRLRRQLRLASRWWASLPLDRYQIILLGEAHTCEQLTAEVEPMIFWIASSAHVPGVF